MRRRAAAAVLPCVLAPALVLGAGRAAEPVSCSGPETAAALQAELPGKLCLEADLLIADLVDEPVYEQTILSLEHVITLQSNETPPSRQCEADIVFEATLKALSYVPMRGLHLHLKLTGRTDGIAYRIGRYDDGGLYVKFANDICWQAERVDNLDKDLLPPGR